MAEGRGRRRRTAWLITTWAFLVSLLVPGVPQAAALAKLPDLVVASVSSGPAAVERGASFTVTVKVKNAGQAVAPTSITRFYLSVDRHRDKGDSRLSTTRRIPELAVGRTSSGKAKLTIPSSTLDGAYYLLACADDTKLVKERTEDNCRSSKTQMEVIAEATTEELIEADVEAGEITAEQGLVYEVFAAFGDTRLPNKYEGDDAGVVDSLVMAEVAGAFDTLPPEHQAAVIPFIRSPAYPGTWEELPTASPSHRSPNRLERTRAARSADPPPMHPSPLGEEGWWFYEHQRARIWFRPDDVGTEEAADPIFESIAEVWTDLTELMGRTPPSDEGPHEFTNPQGVKETWGDGGSGSLDIYISRMAPYLGGLTVPYPPGCTERPSFIILDPSTTQRGDTWVRAVLAHEFMHTLQVAYKKAGTCEDHRSWDESVADWAMDYVYPTDQAE
ncbi:MAG: CARDB domain-containing protein, partial [Actinomycetota bacterium]